MPAQSLTTDVVILAKRPPADTFQTFTVFSPSHGVLLALQRLPKKHSGAPLLDLFDEINLALETANQGQTWFIRETHLLQRHEGIGRDYETLQRACMLASLITKNTIPDESREPVFKLLRIAFGAFARCERADIVYLKSLYCFARDEGYPMRQQWLPSLPADDARLFLEILSQPVAGQPTPPETVERLQRRLDAYLRDFTELHLPSLNA